MPPSDPFLTISHDELARARRRLQQPQWHAAAERLRQSAEAALAKLPAKPSFDTSWYDADPNRDYALTYNEFADYAFPAWEIARIALDLLRADALFQQSRYTEAALDLVRHIIHHFKFHPSHHDAGLNYSHVVVALADICNYVESGAVQFSPCDLAALRSQLEAGAEAIRRSTEHWLTNLARMPYNNHFAHHRHGLLAAALVLQNEQWIEEALNGPRSFGELLVGATTDDGLCYESSTIYHFGTLSGLLQTANLVAHHPALHRDFFHESFANGRGLQDMFDAPLKLLLPTGELPAVGDCYTEREPLWISHAYMYEQGYAAYKEPRYAWLLQQSDRSSRAALFYGEDSLEPVTPPQPRTKFWIEHGYSLLVSHPGTDYFHGNAAFLTGDYSGIHHHQDALSIQLALGGKLWLEDVESQAVALQRFAAPIQKNFNRTMLPHNLVVVDEQDQPDIILPVPIVQFKENPTHPAVAMRDTLLTPGVTRLRHLALTPDYCIDLYQLASDQPHTYDYLIHPRADTAITSSATEFATTTLPDRAPYTTLRHPELTAVPDGVVTLHWSQQNQTLRCDLSTPAPAQLLRAQWPTRSDHTGPWRTMLMFRTHAKSTHFLALYQLTKQNTQPWKITTATRHFNGQTYEFRVTTTDTLHTNHHILAAV